LVTTDFISFGFFLTADTHTFLVFISFYLAPYTMWITKLTNFPCLVELDYIPLTLVNYEQKSLSFAKIKFQCILEK